MPLDETACAQDCIIYGERSPDPAVLGAVQHEIAVTLKLKDAGRQAVNDFRANARARDCAIRAVTTIANNHLHWARGAERECCKKMHVAGEDHIRSGKLVCIRSHLLRAVDGKIYGIEAGENGRQIRGEWVGGTARFLGCADDFGVDTPDGTMGKNPAMTGFSGSAELIKLLLPESDQIGWSVDVVSIRGVHDVQRESIKTDREWRGGDVVFTPLGLWSGVKEAKPSVGASATLLMVAANKNPRRNS